MKSCSQIPHRQLLGYPQFTNILFTGSSQLVNRLPTGLSTSFLVVYKWFMFFTNFFMGLFRNIFLPETGMKMLKKQSGPANVD
jgi:hypothetical protein